MMRSQTRALPRGCRDQMKVAVPNIDAIVANASSAARMQRHGISIEPIGVGDCRKRELCREDAETVGVVVASSWCKRGRKRELCREDAETCMH